MNMYSKEFYNEVIIYLKKHISKKRLEHSLGVAKTAKDLAIRWNTDSEKAYLAGLVHDCAKGMSEEELCTAMRNEELKIGEVEAFSKHILHAPVGAIIAKNVFNITDEDILLAIAYHTVGNEEMSLLQKIIYISDSIEPSRNYDGVEKLRELAFTDIDEAMILALEQSISLVMKQGGLLHDQTVSARNSLVKARGRM